MESAIAASSSTIITVWGAATPRSIARGCRWSPPVSSGRELGPRPPERSPAPVTSALLLGGRYRLEEPIGRGGMASVWRALDVTLDRWVAVKRLHTPHLEDAELSERFRREAQVVARLAH